MRRAFHFALRYAIQYLQGVYDKNTAVTDSEKVILKDCIDKLWSIAAPDKVPF